MSTNYFIFALCLLASNNYFVASIGDDTFVCRPCARSNCYLSDKNKQIDIATIGLTTCGEIQEAADADLYNPEVCSHIQRKTLATSDPCDCQSYSGGDCLKPGFTQDQACNLCGQNNMRIGDPHMIIKSGVLVGNECITAYDLNEFGAFAGETFCPLVQALFAEYCSCIPIGTTIKECIQQEDDRGCDPNDETDICCEGVCRYRNNFGKHVCTHRPATPVPPPPPGPPPPTPAPIVVPATPAPFFSSLPGVTDCDPDVGCGSEFSICAFVGGAHASYKCISRNASNKDAVSLSGGRGGAGGGKRQ